jgi:hypothetical protein
LPTLTTAQVQATITVADGPGGATQSHLSNVVSINLVTANLVSITPSQVSLYGGQSQLFTANLGATSGGDTITWSILSGPGTLSTTSGATTTYTAPATVTTSQTTVVQASVFNATDGTRLATANVTLVPPVSVSVAAVPPVLSPLYPGQSQLLAATVLNSLGTTAVTWTLAGQGTITQAGLYTYTGASVATTTQVTVTATSQFDTTKSASIVLTLSPAVVVTIAPTTVVALFSGQTQQFTATVLNTTNTAVTFTASLGSISATGLFTAPCLAATTQGTVTAASQFDTTKAASAIVEIQACSGPVPFSPFVKELYVGFLGRTADSGGLSFWVGLLNSGTPEPNVAQQFYSGAEFRATAQIVLSNYIGLLGRDPDYAGYAYWIGQVRSGAGQAAMAAAFLGSPEFTATYGSTTDAQFVTLLYFNTLNRAPDAGGQSYWQAQIAAIGRNAVALQFITSAEFLSVQRNRMIANEFYLGFLLRTPDPTGRVFYTNELNQGTSDLFLANQFITSVEYRNLVAMPQFQ